MALNERGKGVIEPQIKLQWFIDVNRPAVEWKGQKRSLKEVMRAVIEDSDIEILPKRFEKTYYRWIDNLRDWCISRQIWWGHQVPVWYKGEELYAGVKPPEGQGWKQDPDTLDTWFSSSLWTWSTLINPELSDDYSLSLQDLLERSPDFSAYHPTSVMETGWDILFFWVARMILSTTYITGQVPFDKVYLHGLVRTEQGKKMSKSDPDSIIDPMDVIPQYGTDALRLALVSGVNAGQDQRLGRSKIVDNRNFCNKLWNIARYIESTGQGQGEPQPTQPADHWILDKSSILTGAVNEDLANFRFSEAYQKLYHFIWDDLADWYIEASKLQPNQAVLRHVLETTLTLLHPFAPFITEAIWQNLGHDDLLASQLLPKAIETDADQAAKFDEIQKIVAESRQIAASMELNKPWLFHDGSQFIEQQKELIERLGRLGGVKDGAGVTRGVRLHSSRDRAWLAVDLKTIDSHLNKLKNRTAEKREIIKTLEGRLVNEDYVAKAPAELVEETRQNISDEKASLKALEQEITSFGKSLDN